MRAHTIVGQGKFAVNASGHSVLPIQIDKRAFVKSIRLYSSAALPAGDCFVCTSPLAAGMPLSMNFTATTTNDETLYLSNFLTFVLTSSTTNALTDNTELGYAYEILSREYYQNNSYIYLIVRANTTADVKYRINVAVPYEIYS